MIVRQNLSWCFGLTLCLYVILISTVAFGALKSSTPPEGFQPNKLSKIVSGYSAATLQSKVLLIQDVDPWSYSSNALALSKAGINYALISSADLVNTDLNEFSVLMYASDQPTSYYQNIAINIDRIKSFVENGNTLIAHSCDYGWNNGTWDGLEILPGNVGHVHEDQELIHIAIPSHPVVQGISDEYFQGWNHSTHGYFTSLPADARIIIETASGQPTYVEYSWGNGRIIATMQTIEWGYGNGIQYNNVFRPEFLQNEIKYIFNVIPYLTFDQSAPNPATVGTAFPITITARKIDGTVDTTFNADVTLSCQGIKLDKGRVHLTNGVWTDQLTINQGEGTNLVIQAGGGGLSGRSNSFSTAGAAGAIGNLYGVVTDDGAIVRSPLPNASVHLSLAANGFDAYTAQTTDSSGRFTFSGVAAGNYYLWATYSEASSPTNYQVTVSTGSMFQSLTIPIAGDTSKLPVILVPGIAGSNDKDRYGVYPRLPRSNYDRNQLQLHDPGQLGVYDLTPGWRNLTEILGPQGKKVKVVDCPWDWRMPIDAAMKKYLKDAIREAKGGNANQKVNIIAHSMGGLLARAYIQGDDYQNDVENLVLVGTPHTGSAKAYFLWEGGAPESADVLSHPNIWFYSKTIKKLMQDLKWPLTGEQDYLNKRNFISSHVRTAKQLLPTYAFLDRGTGPREISTEWNINYDLKYLNNGYSGNDYPKYTKPSDRMGPPNNTEEKVKTRVYYSDTESTVGDVFVRNTTIQGCYEDGEPNGTVWPYSGDGTVFYQSAILPVNDTTKWGDAVSVPGSHVKLVNNAKDLIANFLYPQPATAQKDAATTPTTPTASFFVTFDGWLQPYLADSLGRAVGFNLTSDALENTIPEAKLVTEADGGSLGVENPADGIYTLSLKGKFPGAYRLTLDYMDSVDVVSQEVAGFNDANTTTITIQVDSTNPAKIIIYPQIAAPMSLMSSNVQGKTKLTWQARAVAVLYRVYAMLPGSSDFVLIGSTAATNFLTDDPWLTDNSATPTVYAIVAVKADGITSFFSESAVNKTIPKKKANVAPILSLLLTD